LSRDEGEPGIESQFDREVRTLAARWPRALIEQGAADSLAARWTTSRSASSAAGRPAFAHHPLTPELSSALFEARRSRRLVRGLEAAEEALEGQALGVWRVMPDSGPPAAPSTGAGRISRLLLISADGSDRFYRNINSLMRKYGAMLEALVVTCDELDLGAAAFGKGQRARALLVEHKEAVVRVLGCLEGFV
jgi:hypothetical protein